MKLQDMNLKELQYNCDLLWKILRNTIDLCKKNNIKDFQNEKILKDYLKDVLEIEKELRKRGA